MNWWTNRTNEDPKPVRVGAASDVGRVRDENEDAYGAFLEEADDQLFIVADGMGGHTRGREASTTTVEVVEEAYFDGQRGSVTKRLRHAFREANRRVYEMARSGEGPGSMGTTGTALVLAGERVYVAHVGDSRVYCFRGSESHQLTRDHTVAESMYREGMITEEEAQTHPRRGTLTRAIGVNETVEVDVVEVGTSASDDRFLLCSDGLSSLSEEVMQETVLNNPPQSACEQLIERANERGGHDNATAIIVWVQ